MTNTPRRLKIAAMMMDAPGRIARVETQVAMALGASVQPFTIMTASVRIVVTIRAGEPASWPRKSVNESCIRFHSPALSNPIDYTTAFVKMRSDIC
jgi:hypothetical protein